MPRRIVLRFGGTLNTSAEGFSGLSTRTGGTDRARRRACRGNDICHSEPPCPAQGHFDLSRKLGSEPLNYLAPLPGFARRSVQIERHTIIHHHQHGSIPFHSEAPSHHSFRPSEGISDTVANRFGAGNG